MKLGAFNRSVAVLLAVGCLAITLFSSPVLAAHLGRQKPSFVSAVYLNPNTGRCWTRDSYEGSNSDPLSLHKYLYAHGNPVMNTDPSGRSVYVITRPLNIKGFENAGNGAVHVFLAFDSEGMDLDAWENAVRESCNATEHPNTYGVNYTINASLVTFSFHPKSVLTGDESEQYFGPVLTPSSYIAYSDAIDLNAFEKSGTGYNKWKVATGADLQMRIYNDAVRSRDENNNGTPDPMRYEFTIFNCGSWVDYTLARHGVAFPDKTINHGVGIARSGTGASTAGYYVNAAARMTRTISHAVMDFIFTPVY